MTQRHRGGRGVQTASRRVPWVPTERVATSKQLAVEARQRARAKTARARERDRLQLEAEVDALGETVRTVDVRIRTLQDEMIADMNAEKTTLRPLSRTSKEGAPEEGAG